MDNMLWQAHHGMPITVHKGAERSWCWVGDTVRAMRMTLEARKILSSNLRDHFPAQVYNVGRDDDPRSMLEIAQLACEFAGAPLSLIEEVEAPHNQTVVKRLCTDRVRGLGWEPTMPLEAGMAHVYQWVKQFDAEGVMA
jgi:nucleoside-diphosphate-sugar epimerase